VKPAADQLTQSDGDGGDGMEGGDGSDGGDDFWVFLFVVVVLSVFFFLK